MKKFAALLLTAALTTAVFTGCGASTSTDGTAADTKTDSAQADDASADTDAAAETSDGSEEPITLKVSFTTGMTGAVNSFAIEKGFYKDLGIEFEQVSRPDYNELLSLISRGEIDIADGDPSTFIPAIYNGVPAKMVGNLWRYAGCYWLIANNDIKDFSDLKGKTIGSCAASGGLRLSVLKMLEANGISEDEVTLVANGKHQTAYATLTSGEVDATIIHNPYAALAEAEGTGHILGRAWDYIPDYYTGTIVASDRIIKEEPEKLQRFLNAYYEVHEKVENEYFDEFITWLAQQMDVSEDVMRKAVEDEIDVWSDYPVIPEDRVEKTVEYLKEYGWLDENVQAEGTYTNEFAEKAAETLGLTDPAEK